MTDARLLDCGLCYEENGEEVHPHPECPRGGAGILEDLVVIQRALDRLPAACWYHGTNTEPDTSTCEACCDTGVSAQRRKRAMDALDRLEETP